MPLTPRRPGQVEITLTLLDLQRAGDAPSEVRLRRLLKSLLRAWGFRCVRVQECVPEPEPVPPKEKG